jgi:hypothetical protein
MKVSELKQLIREEIQKALKESYNFDYTDLGQGSGSQFRTMKGKDINKASLKPGMEVRISWIENSGQGSGSQSFETMKGIIKNINTDFVYLQVPEQEIIRNYNKTTAAKYIRTGIPIPMWSITQVTV